MSDEHFYNDLDATLEQVWQRLGRGVADRRSGMRTVQLASLGLDGTPRVRSVVLRGVDRAERLLRVHTDRRSPKFAEISEHPAVEICAYDPRAKVQIRARGSAALATTAAAEPAWAATQPGSRACYRVSAPPGSPLVDPTAVDPQPTPQAPADAGREHFSVVLTTVARLDWLYLAARGHRRARFDWHEGRWQGRWLVP
ncbi:pyridoxamine 5'-phosphate oxidase family protein [uncultured Thiohalocapsa sp.]|uniref:pyridoxamine 5'-phosphate oxidase family protein n=1 Tax=uncultured Thiohalocapsa sp. TaxID=768990 RepID=UPI0025CC7CD8|nr:pyridoxamine 5'-phosphate oxidase family protein [uncultured Thiohalocapsa sp.]